MIGMQNITCFKWNWKPYSEKTSGLTAYKTDAVTMPKYANVKIKNCLLTDLIA